MGTIARSAELMENMKPSAKLDAAIDDLCWEASLNGVVSAEAMAARDKLEELIKQVIGEALLAKPATVPPLETVEVYTEDPYPYSGKRVRLY